MSCHIWSLKCGIMWRIQFIFMLLLGYLHIGRMEAQIPTYNVHLKDLLTLQKGLGWPSQMLVAEGQEALMKLTATLANQESCTVTTPTGASFDVSSPPSNRYQQWSNGCGIRVRQVAQPDGGRWRLTATRGSDSITGWIEVTVHEDTTTYSAPPISLQDGETQTDVVLTSLDNSYCLVAQPFSESSLVAGHCRVTLDRTTRAVQGNWNILIGLPGQISELRVQRQVSVEAERLDVGYIHDGNANKVHMYCNILHTTKNITFCRFQKTTNPTGYNVMEGLSDGAHSYYGDGFVAKECGMTIEHPTFQDYGTWRCSVGSQQWVGDALQQQTPMQALINVMPNHRSQRVGRGIRSETEEERTVFVQEDLSFTLTCRAETSLSYCWFLHPNGTQFSPVRKVNEEQSFWYTGESLQTGDCGITFSHANITDAGNWVCHMGVTNQLGVELSDQIRVRVTGPLAANKKELQGIVGQNAVFHCHTSNGNRPLEYCRFLSPKFVGITIDSSVTPDNAILDRFYFIPGRSLDYGDCSLVIRSVQVEDAGMWTCAAKISGDTMESSDTIELYVGEQDLRAPLSQASIIGMGVGAVVLIILLAAVVWYKIGRSVPWKGTGTGQSFDLMSMNNPSVSRASGEAGSNNNTDGSSASEVEVDIGNLEISSSREPQGNQLRPADPLSSS